MNEKRIFVVVATHTDGGHNFLLHQPIGRIAAQVAHVVSQMRVSLAKQYGDQPITTIVLSVPHTENLEDISGMLRGRNFRVFEFEDKNEEYYNGTSITAICTEPITAQPAILQRLPLWDGR